MDNSTLESLGAASPGREKTKIWILSEGSPGHLSQSKALAEALCELCGARSEIINVRLGLRGFHRHLLRTAGKAWPKFFRSRRMLDFLLPGCPWRERSPDLILSSGGKSVFAGRALSLRTGAPFVFVGERKPYPSSWFHTVLTPSEREVGLNDVRIDLIPTSINPGSITAELERIGAKSGLWTMILGGASKSHRYTETDWLMLGQRMNELAASEGIRWLVTSSRRTGVEAETALKGALNPHYIEEAVWWSDRPEKKMRRFLALGERVFVTQDSVTMVTEAVSSGRPAVVVVPQVVDFPKDSFIPDYLTRVEKSGRIHRISFENLIAPLPKINNPVAMDPAGSIVRGILLPRLGWGTQGSDD